MPFARSSRICARLLIGSSLAALAAPVLAQSADEETGLGEIVVTAQKREQNLQDVPLAISAIAKEQLELRGITEAKQLGAIAPNVSALGGTTSGAAAVITIRGIATAADESQGFDSPIGMYIDGVYLARSAASTFEVADIERVEVLRGPQGTLFGRNTTGGAVNFISREPDKDASLKLKAGIGNYGLWSLRGTFDTGSFADDTMRMSVTALKKRRNGVVDNKLQPKDRLDPGGDDTTGFRWAMVFEPLADFKITNIFDYTKSTGVPLPMQLAAVGAGVTYNPLPEITAFAAANNLTFAAPGPVGPFLAQSSTTIVQPGCPAAVPSSKRVDPICLDNADTSTDKFWGNLLRVEKDFASVKVRSSTAFREWRSRQRGGDLDGLGTVNGAALGAASTTLNGFPASVLSLIMPAANAAFVSSLPVNKANMSLFDAQNTRDQSQFSQEIEVLSNNDNGFNWVVGGFYFQEKGGEANKQQFGFILDTNAAVYNATNFGGLAPALQASNPARYRAAMQDIGLSYRARGKSKAIYGQAEYRPGGADGALGITLGLRYTWDHKYIRRTQNGPTPFTAAEAAINKRDAKFSALTGNLTLDYRMSDDVNVYARVAKGYRSGGFNVRETNATTQGRGGLLPFNNETIWSYEAGFKTQFGNALRLNGAVFYNTYSNLQVTIPVVFGTGNTFGTAVGNAGKVNYMGFELEGQYRPTENFWLDGNLGYTKKDFKKFEVPNNAAQQVNIAKIIEPGYAPDWTASLGVNGRFPLGGDAHAVARVGYTYTSSYFQFTNPLNNPFYRETKGDARGLLDAQLRIAGVGLGNADLELTLWGKNLTDKEYVMRSVDFGALGFATTIYGEPRTFGATLGVTF